MKKLSKMTPTLISPTDNLSVLRELKMRQGLLMASWMLLRRIGPNIVVAMHIMVIEENFKGNSKSVPGPPFMIIIRYRIYTSLKVSA